MGSYFKKTDFDLFYVVRETPRSNKFFKTVGIFYTVWQKINQTKTDFGIFMFGHQRSDFGPKTQDQRTGPWFRTLATEK